MRRRPSLETRAARPQADRRDPRQTGGGGGGKKQIEPGFPFRFEFPERRRPSHSTPAKGPLLCIQMMGKLRHDFRFSIERTRTDTRRVQHTGTRTLAHIPC